MEELTQCMTHEQRNTRRWAITATVIYLLLLLPLLALATTSVMIFDKPDLSIPVGLTLIFSYFCIPLSIIPALCLIWSRYTRSEYQKARRFCLLPLGICAGSIALSILATLCGLA